MGRLIFLSTVAFIAYRYIARSNKQHQQLSPGENKSMDIISPAAVNAPLGAPASSLQSSASETVAHASLVGASSRAAESDPFR